MRRRDRAIGIALGVVLGIAIVILFVFLSSENTVDAPSINHGGEPAQSAPAPNRPH